ncbi:hypothetical protein [uncultured Mediterranean phage uvMED]|nr:hypothetical protein [uncultured Mediterranean phage uvMED]
MTTIVTRSGKGSPLTNNEVDANFTNLKTTADAALPLSGGTLTGSLTAPSLTVDNITIDGNEIDVGSGNFTLDVAGDIILDSDGGLIEFKNGGTRFGRFTHANSNLELQSMENSGDILLRGKDSGGNNVTALTLDMSAAGFATFNSGISVGDNATFLGAQNTIRADDGFLRIEETDGTDIAYLGDITGAGVGGLFLYNHGGSGDTILRADAASTIAHGLNVGGAATFSGAITADAGVVVDNITIDGNEIDLSSGDLTLDVAGDIVLDAGGGDWAFNDDGVTIGTFANVNSGDFRIRSHVANKDIFFMGLDGSSHITALTLDMSDGGTATFNSHIRLGDNKTASFGAGFDIEITSDGTNGTIGAPNGNLTLDVAGDIILDAAGDDIIFKTGGVEFGSIFYTNSNLYLNSSISNGDMVFRGNDGGSAINALVLDMSTGGTAYFSDDVRLTDNHALRLGTDGDIVFYHDNSNGYLENGTGDLTIDSAGYIRLDADSSNIYLADGGTDIGLLSTNNQDLNIRNLRTDKDIYFQGNNGGSTFTALTLDMSNAGAATFNSTVTVGSNMGNFIPVTSGTTGASLNANGNGLLQLQSGGVTKATINDSGVFTCNGGVVVDNITIDGQEIDVSSGVLTLDVASDIRLDAGGGNIQLLKGGAEFGRFFESGTNDFYVYNPNSDKDIIIYGNDAGTSFEAARFDMSQAGRATFNEGIVLKSSTAGDFGVNINTAAGDSMKLQVVDTGSAGAAHGSIAVSDGDLTLDVAGSLYLDSDDGLVYLLDGGSTFGEISKSGNDLRMTSFIANGDLVFRGNDSDGGGYFTALTLDMSAAGAATFNSSVTIPADIIHAGDTDTKLQFNANDSFRVITGNEERIKANNGEVVVNDNSADMDFRVESNGNANMLCVDGGNSTVTVGSNISNAGAPFLVDYNNTSKFMVGGIQAGVSNNIYYNGSAWRSLNNSVGGGILQISTDGSFAFRRGTASSTPSLSYSAYIDLNGNFGLGTTTPTNYSNKTTLAINDVWGGQIDLELGEVVRSSWKLDTSQNTYFGTGANDTRLFLQVNDTNIAEFTSSNIIFNEAGSDVDFRVESDSQSHMLFVDASAHKVGINQSNPAATLDIVTVSTAGSDAIRLRQPASSETYQIQMGVSGATNNGLYLRNTGSTGQLQSWTAGEVVINDDSVDRDFRVESNGYTHAFFVDGGTNNLGMGTTTTWPLDGGGSGTASSGLELDMAYDGTMWAGSSYWAGGLKTGTCFWSDASGDHYKRSSRYATMHFHNSQGGSQRFYTADTGTNGNVISWKSQLELNRTDAVFNEAGLDRDFRVEGDSDTHALFIEASSNVVNFGRGSSNVNSNGGYILGGECIMSTGSTAATYLVRNTSTFAYSFYVSGAGQISAVQTSISSLSDKRLKENIVDLDTGLDEVMALKPRKFDWKEGEGSGEKNVSGFIAQEVETVLPDLIGDFKHDDLNDAKSVKMGDMVPTLVKAIQEQQTLIETLTARITALENA